VMMMMMMVMLLQAAGEIKVVGVDVV